MACGVRNECRPSKDRAERRANTEATDEEKKLADSVDNECEQKFGMPRSNEEEVLKLLSCPEQSQRQHVRKEYE